MQSMKESVAIVIEDDSGKFLAVKRSQDDSFAGQWGLPAASLRSGETAEEAAKRAAKDKLGVEIEVLEVVGDLAQQKEHPSTHLIEFRARIVGGKLSLAERDATVSHYDAFRYSEDPRILIPAAKAGSLCSRIFLKSNGLDWK